MGPTMREFLGAFREASPTLHSIASVVLSTAEIQI